MKEKQAEEDLSLWKSVQWLDYQAVYLQVTEAQTEEELYAISERVSKQVDRCPVIKLIGEVYLKSRGELLSHLRRKVQRQKEIEWWTKELLNISAAVSRSEGALAALLLMTEKSPEIKKEKRCANEISILKDESVKNAPESRKKKTKARSTKVGKVDSSNGRGGTENETIPDVKGFLEVIELVKTMMRPCEDFYTLGIKGTTDKLTGLVIYMSKNLKKHKEYLNKIRKQFPGVIIEMKLIGKV